MMMFVSFDVDAACSNWWLFACTARNTYELWYFDISTTKILRMLFGLCISIFGWLFYLVLIIIMKIIITKIVITAIIIIMVIIVSYKVKINRWWHIQRNLESQKIQQQQQQQSTVVKKLYEWMINQRI